MVACGPTSGLCVATGVAGATSDEVSTPNSAASDGLEKARAAVPLLEDTPWPSVFASALAMESLVDVVNARACRLCGRRAAPE